MKLKLLTLSSLHRQEKRRDGCCCCVALPDNYRENSFAKRNLLRTCMNKYIGPVMLSLPGKVSICKSDTNLSLNSSAIIFFIVFSRVILPSLVLLGASLLVSLFWARLWFQGERFIADGRGE